MDRRKFIVGSGAATALMGTNALMAGAANPTRDDGVGAFE